MKASWKKLDSDAAKVCLEIILMVGNHTQQMSKDVASYGFIRTINYEDIFLLMIEGGLVFENALSILLNKKKKCLKKLQDSCDYTYDTEIFRIVWNFYSSIIQVYFLRLEWS